MQPNAVRASPIAAFDRSVIVRITAASLALGLLLSFVGAFSLDDDPLVLRTAWILGVSLAGAVLNVLAYQAALAVPWARQFWARVGIAAALVALVMAVIVWASLWLLGGRPGFEVLALGFLNAFAVGGAFVAVLVAPTMEAAARRAGAEPVAPYAAGVTSDLTDRLPERLRGGAIWALQAEDHYVRVHTSRGAALIRLRMTDALRELGDIEGAQTHRSWWVARAAVREVKRAGGRITLILPNGEGAAVSRAAAPTLRATGWF
jgi:DNA-binding LytR/AlgR family response regulator